MSAQTDGRMRIDELAQRTGMTVRNIRAHQSRGLLPPPEVRGRTGYYGNEHEERIGLIRALQADGLNLEAIRRLLDDGGEAGTEVLDFARLLRAPFEDEEPEVIDASELAERWSVTDAERARSLTRRCAELGLLRPIGRGRLEILSPRLQRAAEELADLGVSAEQAVEVLASVRAHADAVSQVYLDLFFSSVWEEFESAGRPPQDWPKVIDALRRMRPLVIDSVVAIFGIAMSEATEGALERLDFTREPGDARVGGPPG